MAIKIASVFEGFNDKPKDSPADRSTPKKPKNSEVNVVRGENTKSEIGITPDMIKGIEKCMSEMTERLAKLETGPQAPQRRYDKSNVQCFKCKEYGHYSRNCPQNKARSDPAGPRPEPGQTRQEGPGSRPHLN